MTTSQTAAATGLPETFSALEAADHAAATRTVAEGLYLAAHGLSDKAERDAMAVLIMYLNDRLDVLVAALRASVQPGAQS
jgi:hypothetical protein